MGEEGNHVWFEEHQEADLMVLRKSFLMESFLAMVRPLHKVPNDTGSHGVKDYG